MAETSPIEWTDATWTPIRARCVEIQNDGSGKERIGWHCEHVSPGCVNCYAESINRRLGTGLAFKPANLRARPAFHGGTADRAEVFLDEKMLMAPLRWKRPRMIFVCSMTDLFADFVPDEWIDRVFAVMALAPQHRFQVLTKRSARMLAYLTDRDCSLRVFTAAERWHGRQWHDARAASMRAENWPLPNVWLGVSAEDQRRADERVPDLLATPAAVRWVSAEPLLGQIDFTCLAEDGWSAINALRSYTVAQAREDWGESFEEECGLTEDRPALDWIVAGGESGPGARPMHPGWARKIRDDCADAGVAFHFKQWGAWAPFDLRSEYPGGDPVPFLPTGERLRWLPPRVWRGFADQTLVGVGKKRAGRTLDGRTHDDMPAVRP